MSGSGRAWVPFVDTRTDRDDNVTRMVVDWTADGIGTTSVPISATAGCASL
jgi:hypothetical protein